MVFLAAISLAYLGWAGKLVGASPANRSPIKKIAVRSEVGRKMNFRRGAAANRQDFILELKPLRPPAPSGTRSGYKNVKY